MMGDRGTWKQPILGVSLPLRQERGQGNGRARSQQLISKNAEGAKDSSFLEEHPPIE